MFCSRIPAAASFILQRESSAKVIPPGSTHRRDSGGIEK
jgi:hypothetical protein